VQLLHDAKPVAGVGLRFHAAAAAGVWSGATVVSKSDPEGHARVEFCEGASLEVLDQAWKLESGQRVPVAAGQVNVVPLIPVLAKRLILQGEEGRLAGWSVSFGSATAGSTPSRTDEDGTVAMPRQQPLPIFMPVAKGPRFHLFSLKSAPASRTTLLVPPAKYRTSLRVDVGEGRVIEGGRVFLALPRFGISVPLDDAHAADLDYGMLQLPVTVSVPGFFPRTLSLKGEPEVVLQLAETGERTFQLVDAQGARVPDGTVVTAVLKGPDVYPPSERPRPTSTRGETTDGMATLTGLPQGPVRLLLHAQGPGIHTVRHLHLSSDGGKPLVVHVDHGRRVAFDVTSRGSAAEGSVPVHGVLSLIVERGEEYGFPPHLKLRELTPLISGRFLPWPFWVATVLASRGPRPRIELPSNDQDVCVHVVRLPDWIGSVLIHPKEDRLSVPVSLLRVGVPATSGAKRVKIHATLANGRPATYCLLHLTPRGGDAADLDLVTDGNGDVWSSRTGTYDVWATTQDGTLLEASQVFLEPGGSLRIRLREP